MTSDHSVTHAEHLLIAGTDKGRAQFNPDAFKAAFFWPVAEPKKSKKCGEKVSSVMSSEDWRNHERQKNDEKQQKQMELDARKAARAAKKLEASKLAAEKLALKQQKQASSKKSAENKPPSTKPNTRKRTAKATKTN